VGVGLVGCDGLLFLSVFQSDCAAMARREWRTDMSSDMISDHSSEYPEPNETSSNQSQILVISFIFIFIGDEKSLQKAEGTYNTECRLG